MSAHAVPIGASPSVIEQLLTRENRLTTSIILCRLVQKLSEVVNVRLQLNTEPINVHQRRFRKSRKVLVQATKADQRLSFIHSQHPFTARGVVEREEVLYFEALKQLSLFGAGKKRSEFALTAFHPLHHCIQEESPTLSFSFLCQLDWQFCNSAAFWQRVYGFSLGTCADEKKSRKNHRMLKEGFAPDAADRRNDGRSHAG